MNVELVLKYFHDLSSQNVELAQNASVQLINMMNDPQYLFILIELTKNNDIFIKKQACTLLNVTLNHIKSNLTPELAFQYFSNFITNFITFSIALSHLTFTFVSNLAQCFDSMPILNEYLQILIQKNDSLHLILLCLIPSFDLEQNSQLVFDLIQNNIISENPLILNYVLFLIHGLLLSKELSDEEMTAIQTLVANCIISNTNQRNETSLREISYHISLFFQNQIEIIKIEQLFDFILEQIDSDTSPSIKCMLCNLMFILLSMNPRVEIENLDKIIDLLIQTGINLYDSTKEFNEQLMDCVNDPIYSLIIKLPKEDANQFVLQKFVELVEIGDNSCFLMAINLIQSIVDGYIDLFDDEQYQNLYNDLYNILDQGDIILKTAVIGLYSSIFKDLIINVNTFPFHEVIQKLLEIYTEFKLIEALKVTYAVILRINVSTDSIFEELFNFINQLIENESNASICVDYINVLSALVQNSENIISQNNQLLFDYVNQFLKFDESVDLDIVNAFLHFIKCCISNAKEFYQNYSEYFDNVIIQAFLTKNPHIFMSAEMIIENISNFNQDFILKYNIELLTNTFEMFQIIINEPSSPMEFECCMKMFLLITIMNHENLNNEEIARKLIDMLSIAVKFAFDNNKSVMAIIISLYQILFKKMQENQELFAVLVEIHVQLLTYIENDIRNQETVEILNCLIKYMGNHAFLDQGIAIFELIMQRLSNQTSNFFISDDLILNYKEIAGKIVSSIETTDEIAVLVPKYMPYLMKSLNTEDGNLFAAISLLSSFLQKNLIEPSLIREIISSCLLQIENSKFCVCELLISLVMSNPASIPLFIDQLCAIFLNTIKLIEANEIFIALMCCIYCLTDNAALNEEIHGKILSLLPLKKNLRYNTFVLWYLIKLDDNLPENLVNLYCLCITNHLCHPISDFPRLMYPDDTTRNLAVIFRNRLMNTENWLQNISMILDNNQERIQILLQTLRSICEDVAE